jgi:Flp pilus assembly protein TadG
MTSRRQRERGASAVEFALVLPFLLLLIGGMVDFGRFFFTQNIVVNAAREGARMRALGYSTTEAGTRIDQALTGLQTGPGDYTVVYTSEPSGTVDADCPSTPIATDAQRVSIVYSNFSFIFLEPISGILTVTPNGAAEMRCGG